jgi:hypothetical protein
MIIRRYRCICSYPLQHHPEQKQGYYIDRKDNPDCRYLFFHALHVKYQEGDEEESEISEYNDKPLSFQVLPRIVPGKHTDLI